MGEYIVVTTLEKAGTKSTLIIAFGGEGGTLPKSVFIPTDPDVIFVGNIASYRSDDGGRTWTSIKGAPGGDDYHRIWINPEQPEIMLFVADQGAVVTVNAGENLELLV